MPTLHVVDDLQRELILPRAPERIVSLVPSETQNLFALGAGARVVGATDYCVEPAEAKSLPRVGGTKDADIERIAALSPDLVLMNQEENARGILKLLAERHIPVFISFPRTVGEGVSHLARLARLLELAGDARAKSAVGAAYAGLKQAESLLAADAREGRAPLATFLPIWMEPLMTISGETFVSDALRLAGAQNLFAERRRRYPLAADLGRAEALSDEQVGKRDTRYPRVTLEEVQGLDPQLVLLPDEPHEFSEADAKLFASQPTRAARTGAVLRCNGRDLMWPGARSAEGLPRLRAIVEHARALIAHASAPRA